jgi:hypothetical protein
MSLDLSSCRKYTNCKVCQIANWSIPTFIQLHKLAIQDRYDHLALQKWINKEIQLHNNQAPPADQYEFVTKSQLSTHLNQHVSVLDTVKMKVDPVMSTKGVEPFDPIVGRKLQELAEQADALGVSDLDDFQMYHATLRRMQKRFNELDRYFDVKNQVPDKDLLIAYKSFGDSVGKMLAESIKMRQQERILQSAVAAALDTMSMQSAQAILRVIDKAWQELRPHADSEKAELVRQRLHAEVAKNISSGARTALDHLKSMLKTA